MKRLSEFLPQDKKLSLFNLVLASYENSDEELSKSLKCDAQLIDKWSEEGPDDKYMPRILELAFQRCADTKEIIMETINEFEGLSKSLGIKATKSKLSIFMNGLDVKSKEIIWYLLRNGHAGIRELSDVINASTDMDVLTRVRDIINPRSEKTFGKEIMKFENSKIDPITGDKILFSWWLTEEIPKFERPNEMLDVFDEDGHIKVIAELPICKEDIETSLANNILTISTDGYQKNIPLFSFVEKITEKTYKNGILEVRLSKTRGDINV